MSSEQPSPQRYREIVARILHEAGFQNVSTTLDITPVEGPEVVVITPTGRVRFPYNDCLFLSMKDLIQRVIDETRKVYGGLELA